MEYYAKQVIDGAVVSVLTYSQKPVFTEADMEMGFSEITQEEYEAILAELLANVVEPEQPDNPYEIIDILTGEA